ncbi:hypothetical protein BDB00DRAFT_499450 [Zychaea mexicana]|uniref:uncharacterized protein n=1 Tax=Zychaea mexicana TaxID=64656 RepID=UPI0022FF3617|nr:uncharacterized protein BDB00DRAFT_499450 [Zychaea mexicana]KAI9498117.1 hypothetical protein BDB00DRAFT_499450 [Zychaea mexicana]
MADDPTLTIRAFDRHCFGAVCHCDWRLTLQDCEETTAMWYINILNVAISGLGCLIGIALLIHRIGLKGHTLWSHRGSGRGLLRPKPVDCMLSFFVLFDGARLATSVVLVTDAGAGNLLARSILYELPWSFGMAGITMYLLGIAQTISQSNSASGWLPSPTVVDIVGIIALLSPLIGIPLTLAAGSIVHDDQQTAELLIRVSYCIWFIWTGGLGTAVLFAGDRLVRILRSHHKKLRQGSDDTAVKAGILKIQVAVAAFSICLWSFALVLLLYGILRNQIMENTIGSIFLGTAWNQFAGVTILIVEISIMASFKTGKNAALRSKKSTDGSGSDNTATSTTQPDRRVGGQSTIGAMSATIQGDNEAILHALKTNNGDVHYNQQQYHQNEPPKINKTSFFSRNPTKRRQSEASSQMELTSYEHH